MTEIDLLLFGFIKVSMRETKLSSNNLVSIKYAYKKGNFILYQKNDVYCFLDQEIEYPVRTIKELKLYVENYSKNTSLKAS